MNTNDSARSGDPDHSTLPDPVAAHELAFGRECTSGYLLEQEARHVAPVEACAEQLHASWTQHVSLEQHKPTHSIRI